MRILLAVIATAATGCSAPRTPPTRPAIANAAPAAVPTPTCAGADCLPALDYVDTRGARHAREALAGQVVVVNFWATWVRPSQKEIPQLAQTYDAYKARGVIVLGVLTDDVADPDLAAFVAEHAITYPIVRATAEILTAYASPGALPTTFVFDRGGRQVAHHVGPLDRTALAAILDPLVAAR